MAPVLPPQSIDAERAVLGSIMLDPEAVLKVADALKPEHFYRGTHATIYQTILVLWGRQEKVDIVTLSEELKRHKQLDKIGGSGYLAELTEAVPTAAHIESYASLVRESAIRRSLLEATLQLQKDALDASKPIDELVTTTESKLLTLSQGRFDQRFIHVKDHLEEAILHLDRIQKKEEIRGIPSGFISLDHQLGGFQDGNLVILAARPSVGKTSLALNIATNVALRDHLPVGFFSLESSSKELIERLIASTAEIDSFKIQTANLQPSDWSRISESMGELSEAPLFIEDTPALSISDIRAKARRLQLEHGLRFVVVDYLQLARSRNLENRVQEVSEISQGLKALARELRCPVLALSQLSRAVEQRGKGSVPLLSDLRDSGSIEQDADVVMFLHREEDGIPSRTATSTIPVKLTVAKHRNGPVGELTMHFCGSKTKYYECAI